MLVKQIRNDVFKFCLSFRLMSNGCLLFFSILVDNFSKVFRNLYTFLFQLTSKNCIILNYGKRSFFTVSLSILVRDRDETKISIELLHLNEILSDREKFQSKTILRI